jgi:hypothetical protein
MVDNGYPSIWNTDYLRFCDKNFFRVIEANGQSHVDKQKVALSIFLLFVLFISTVSLILLKRK